MNVRDIPKIRLLSMKAVLRTQHGGPGPHPSGSSQDVHGERGAGSDVERLPLTKRNLNKIIKFSSSRYNEYKKSEVVERAFQLLTGTYKNPYEPNKKKMVFTSGSYTQSGSMSGRDWLIDATDYSVSVGVAQYPQGFTRHQTWYFQSPLDVNLNRVRLVLSHDGPGPHKDGSPQSVHGGGRGGSTSTSTTARAGGSKAGGKGMSKIKKSGKYTWRDPDGKMHESDAFIVDRFGAMPSSGMGAIGVRGPGKGSIVYTPETIPSHAKSIRAFYPGDDTQDDFVRFYFKGDTLEFSVTSAGESTFTSGWADRGVDNIYSVLDRLSAAGVPGGTKIKVKGGKSAFETTL